MATSGSFTIGGTSPDYATVQAWADSPTGNLTGVYEGKIRAGTYTERADIDMAGNGYTTTDANHMKLTYDTGAYHGGDWYSGVQMQGAKAPHSGVAHILQVATDYTRIIGLNFNRWVGTSDEAIRMNATGCVIEYNLFWGNNGINADGIFWNRTGTGDTCFISNNLFAFLGRTSVHVQGDKAGSLYVYQNTAVGMNCGNQNTGDGTFRSYVGMGEDQQDYPTTNGVTWFLKNNYVHCQPDANGTMAPCFAIASGGASSYDTSSGYNASADATASDVHATNYQNNAGWETQFAESGTEVRVGENTADDLSGATDDAYLNAGATSTNYGSSVEMVHDNSPVMRPIIRISLANVSGSARIAMAVLNMQKANTTSTNQTVGWVRPARAWTEGGVTWNQYSAGNNWATAGGLGSGDCSTYDSEGAVATATTRSAGFENATVTGGGQIDAGEWFSLSGGMFVDWAQDAVDGNSPGTADYFDVLMKEHAGVTNTNFDSSDDTDGERPYMRLRYDTSAAPFDFTPVVAGVLDGNGTDLSSDTNYPISSTDLYGNTRDASWDVGAVAYAPAQTLTGTLVTQAGVAYDGSFLQETFLAGSVIEQAGVPNLGTLIGADYLPPVIDYFGEEWTGSHKDIDEEPASDVDFIASPAAPNPVILLDEGFESGTTGWSLDADISRVNPGDAYEGSYVLRAVSSSVREARFTDPHPAWPVDPNALYRISFAMRHSGTAGQFYAAIRSRNASGIEIMPWMQAVYQHSLTWLTVATSPTDTTITVADATHWVDGTNAAVIVFDALPDMSDIEATSIPSTKYRGIAVGGISGNVITLAGAETVGASYPAGTWVRCHRHTGTFMYPMANIQPADGNWHTYSKLFGGMRSLRDRFFNPYIERYDGDMWRMASVDFTVSFLMNYQASGSNTTDLDAVKVERLDNAKLMRVAISQEVGIDGSDHVRYRIRKDVAVGTVNVKVSLLQKNADGAGVYHRWDFTEINSWQHNNVGTGWTDYKQTITNDGLLDDRSQLYLLFEVTSS